MINDEDQAMSNAKVTALATNIPVQLGQSLQLTTNGATAVAAKDLVRWKGKSPSDLQAVRIYLGPLQPRPGLEASIPNPPAPPPAFVEYEPPTFWQTPIAGQYDRMYTGLYARISFGGGGVQHVAYVDWPTRGCVVQVSANYVQVDAQGTLVLTPGPEQELPLPRLLAHVAPEPGGGDSVQPATFTYPPRFFNPNPSGGVLFQIPPFARAFRPDLDQQRAIDNDVIYFVRTMTTPNGAVLSSWFIDPLDANGFNRDDLPIDGRAGDVIVTGFVRSTFPTTLTDVSIDHVGMMFLLDL